MGISTSKKAKLFFTVIISFMLIYCFVSFLKLPNAISQLEIVTDTTQKLDIHQVKAIPDRGWQTYKTSTKVFIPLAASDYWVKTDFINRDNYEQLWTIGFKYAFAEFLEFYHVIDNKVISTQKINIRDIGEDPKQTITLFDFSFLQPPVTKSTIYIRYHLKGLSIISLLALPQKRYYNLTRGLEFWLGILFGIMIGLCFYNLFLYLLTKESTYFYYCCFQGFVILYHLLINGVFHWHYPQLTAYPYLLARLALISLSISIIFGIQFVLLYLISFRDSLIYMYFKFVMLAGIMLVFLTLFANVPILVYLAITLIFFANIAVVPTFLKYIDFDTIFWLGMAWCGPIIAGGLFFAGFGNMIPFTLIHFYYEIAGFSLQAIMLSFAVGFKLRTMQDEKASIKRALLGQESHTKLNEILELPDDPVKSAMKESLPSCLSTL